MAISESTTQQPGSGELLPQSAAATFKRRYLTVSSGAASPSSGSAPFIRLMGHWLEQAGFSIGEKVTVDVRAGRLVIDLVPPEPDRNLGAPQRPYISERMTMIYDAAASEGVTPTSAGARVS